MADVQYYINSTAITVNTSETWGQQDINGDNTPDAGTFPMAMEIYANEDYTVDANNFTIKGYEPTSTFINNDGYEVREWLNGSSTTDASGNTIESVVIGGQNTIGINKVQMFNTSIIGSEVLWPDSGYTDSDLNNGTLVTNSTPLIYVQDIFNVGNSQYSNGGFSNILIGGTPIQPGDVFGAFYEEDGNFICAGIHQWTNATLYNTGNVWMSIYGDLSQHPWVNPDGIYDLANPNPGFGFTLGQEIHFFILQQSTGDTYKYENTEWLSSCGDCYDPSIGFHGDVNFDAVADGTTNEAPTPIAYPTVGSINTTLNDFTNTSLYEASSSVTTDNYIKVTAWLDSGYSIIGDSNIELNLDIDGDAQPVDTNDDPPITGTWTDISLNMANGENSNCIVHVFAKTYQGYTSGNYTIPPLAPTQDSYLEVIDILQTGVSSKATVRIGLTTIGQNSLDVLAGNFAVGPEGTTINQNFGAIDNVSLSRLFYFIIEPLPGYSLHQGWVAPGLYRFDGQNFGTPSNGVTFPYDVTTIVPWWENYETYIDSPLEPGFMVPDPLPSSPNGYWWPGFATQYFKYRYEVNGVSEEGAMGPPGGDFQLLQDIGFQPEPGVGSSAGGGSLEAYFMNHWQVKQGDTEWWGTLGTADFNGDTTPYLSSTSLEISSTEEQPHIKIFNTTQTGPPPWDYNNFEISECSASICPGALSQFSVADFEGNNVIVDLHRQLMMVNMYNYSGRELILNILGGAQFIGGEVETVEMNSIVTYP